MTKNTTWNRLATVSSAVIKVSATLAAITALCTGAYTAINYFNIRPILSKEHSILEQKVESLDIRMGIQDALTDQYIQNIAKIAQMLIATKLKELRSSGSENTEDWQMICDLTREVIFYKGEIPPECKAYPNKKTLSFIPQ